MAYRCRDCSHKALRFSQGSCPACGSFNIASVNADQKQVEARKPYSLVALIVLWGYLAYALVSKLFFPA